MTDCKNISTKDLYIHSPPSILWRTIDHSATKWLDRKMMWLSAAVAVAACIQGAVVAPGAVAIILAGRIISLATRTIVRTSVQPF